MASWNYFNSFVEALAEKKHNLGSDTLKCALTNTAPSATDTVFDPGAGTVAGIHPAPAEANGYTPTQAVQSASAQTAGTYKLTLADVVFTAASGQIGPFRYVILYNDDAAGDELIGWFDYGSSITLEDTETFTVDFDASAGALTIGPAA